MLSRLLYMLFNKYKPSTMKAQCYRNKLSEIGRDEKNEDYFPIYILNVQIEQQKDLRTLNYKLRAYI